MLFVLDAIDAGCTEVVDEDDEGRTDPETDLVDGVSLTPDEDVGIVVWAVASCKIKYQRMLNEHLFRITVIWETISDNS